MKLQVKDSGAWRDVVRFEAERELEVRDAGAALLRATGCSRTAMRTIEGDQVRAYCEHPFTAWRGA